MLFAPAIIASAFALQVAAQTPAAPGVEASAPVSPQSAGALQRAEPQRPRRICETRAPTGRRLQQRICYTPEEHAALIEAKRREAEEIVGSRSIQNDRGIVGIPVPN